MKKIMFALLLLTTFGSSAIVAQAEEVETDGTVIMEMSEEEYAKVLQSDIEKARADALSKDRTRAGWNEYEYKVDIINDETKLVRCGYAGGQPSKGTAFANPGGFYWQDGGYNVSVSVGVSFGNYSASVSLGKTGGTGQYISVPSTNVYYKLVVSRNIRVTKTKQYRRLKGTSKWEFFTNYTSVTPVSVRLSTERV